MDDIKMMIDKYIQDQEYTRAIEELNILIEKYKEQVIWLKYRGDIYYITQKYAKALNDYNKVLNSDLRTREVAAKIEMIKDILKFEALDIYSATNLNNDPWLDD